MDENIIGSSNQAVAANMYEWLQSYIAVCETLQIKPMTEGYDDRLQSTDNSAENDVPK